MSAPSQKKSSSNVPAPKKRVLMQPPPLPYHTFRPTLGGGLPALLYGSALQVQRPPSPPVADLPPYEVKHPILREFNEAAWIQQDAMTNLHSPGRGVVQAKFLSDAVCDALIEEAEQICAERSETMTQTGLHLNKYGLDFAFSDTFCTYLADRLMKATLLRPASRLTCTTCFVIRYGNDETHEIHADDSDITLNVCLGGKFEQANLFFGNYASPDESEEPTDSAPPSPVPSPAYQPFFDPFAPTPMPPFERECEILHQRGSATFHGGCLLHGTDALKAGEVDGASRYTLVAWFNVESEFALWPELSTELKMHILSFLSPRDLGRCSQTCREMQVLAEQDMLWRPLFYEKFDCENFRRMCDNDPAEMTPPWMRSSPDAPSLGKKEGPWDQPPPGSTWMAYYKESLTRHSEHLRILLRSQIMMKCTYRMQMERDNHIAARCALRDVSYRNMRQQPLITHGLP